MKEIHGRLTINSEYITKILNLMKRRDKGGVCIGMRH